MNKKVIRTFIAVCLMIAMTTTTALASTKTYNRDIRFKILTNGKHDYLALHTNGRDVSARISGHIELIYDTQTKKYQVSVKDLTFVGDNASKYSYMVKRYSPSKIHIIIQTADRDIGYLYYHADSTGLHKHCINY